MAIYTESLSVTYGKSGLVLNQLSFHAESGRITYLAGRNGAGKTTWLKAICCLLPSGSCKGSVLFDGQSFEKVRHNVCVVFDTPPVYPRLSCYDNLYILYQQDYRTEISKKVFQDLGLSDRLLKQKAGNLSLGQRHRFGIAAGLLCDADYYILDEPDIGLDPDGINGLTEYLKELRENNKTVIVTGQNYRLYDSIADDIVVLNNGVCTYAGSIVDFKRQYALNDDLKQAFENAVNGEENA